MRWCDVLSMLPIYRSYGANLHKNKMLSLSQQYCSQEGNVCTGSRIGMLYTVNTFGAVLGTFLAGFFFIPMCGLRNTVLIASCLSFLILIVTSLLTKGENAGFRTRGLFRIEWSTTPKHFYEKG